jgi:hypothetical protein
MKIVVIGGSAYIRSETAERLRGKGHEAVAASPRRRVNAITLAPRDPGHAGRHLRHLLESIISIFRSLRLGRLPRRLRGHELQGRMSGRRDDGIR